MTTFALDIVISKVRGLNTAGRIQCGIARLGSAQQNTAKSPEIDTRKNSTFPAALFRILVQDTIYDKVIISVFRNKKLSRDLLGHVVIPVSCVSTMSCVPRATTCWLPIRKPKDAQFAQRGELLVSLSFLDGLVTTSLPRTLTVPTPGSVVVKIVEAQSIGTVRADICASVFVSSLKHPLEQRTSTKHKVLCPVWNEDFHFDIAEPLVDVITVELKTPKRYIGKTTIPVSHVAFRAGLSNGKASCDFWWPLLDKMAHNQLQNFKTQGKLHIVMYYNTQPPKAEWKEPVNLVAHVQRLSSKNKWVSRYLLLQGSTTVPATIYNFHERGWAEAQMLDHATSGVVAVGAKIGGVRVPASVSCPQDRTLSFTAFDSSTHVFVFEDSATRDTWYQALLQLATVEGNWYDPNLDGVTPTLCAIAPLVRSQSDHKPGSESTLKRKGLLKTQPSSASLLTTQMNYFIEPSGSAAATARENDTNSDREQLSRSSQSDRNFELPQAPHPDSRMRATTSYPGLHSHTMAFDIDPLENLSALNAMSEQERALRQEFAASDSDSDNDDSSTPPAADYQLPPGVDPPTPSPENSPEPSPRNLLDAADNAAAVGGFRRASSPTPPKFTLPHSNYSSESTQSSSAPPRRPKAETTVSRSSNPLVRSETHGTAIDIMNDIMGGGEAADNATLAAPAVPPKRRSRSPDAPRLPPKKSERVKKHDTQAASIAAAAQAAMANRKPGARQLSPRERQVTARNQAGGGPFRKAGRGRGRGAAPLPVPPKKAAAAAAAATPSSPGDPPPTPPGTPPLPDPQSTYDVVPPLESTYDQVEVPDMPTSLDTSTTTLQPDDTYQQIPLAPADSTESSTTHTTASELPPWGGDMVSVNLDREGNAPMRVRTVSQADRAAEENKC